jgi:hypothetical protein
MASFRKRYVDWLLILAVAVLGIYGYSAYRRTAVTRYMQSQSFFELFEYLPKNTNSDNRVTVEIDSAHVTVHVDVRNEDEFDRLIRASEREDRSALERLILVWKGVEYRL